MKGPNYGIYANGFGVLTADAMKWFGGHYLARPKDAPVIDDAVAAQRYASEALRKALG